MQMVLAILEEGTKKKEILNDLIRRRPLGKMDPIGEEVFTRHLNQPKGSVSFLKSILR